MMIALGWEGWEHVIIINLECKWYMWKFGLADEIDKCSFCISRYRKQKSIELNIYCLRNGN